MVKFFKENLFLATVESGETMTLQTTLNTTKDEQVLVEEDDKMCCYSLLSIIMPGLDRTYILITNNSWTTDILIQIRPI